MDLFLPVLAAIVFALLFSTFKVLREYERGAAGSFAYRPKIRSPANSSHLNSPSSMFDSTRR
jgi:regulator of protease activity HflC (stomatin/prohibitin superfamily)